MNKELTKIQEKEIKKEILEKHTYEEIIALIKKYQEYIIKSSLLGLIFEILYIDNGFSPNISMEELIKIHPSFRTRNGSTWCREDQSYLGKKYQLRKTYSNKNSIATVRADGFNQNHKIRQDIKKEIVDSIKTKRCVILDIGTNIECDHKEGMKEDWTLNNTANQKLEDFQPLCKTANDAKRGHCKKCKDTGKRYDAKKLGYSCSYLYGDENTKTCQGCYWFDPIEFNKKISENYKKDR